MIVTRSPFRIPLGGGGTDLPSYYEKFGGSLVTAGINKYMYVNVNRLPVESEILLKYSQSERVDNINDLKHDIARESLRLLGLNRAIEISSMADIPAGTGMGSSSSYSTALLKALHTLKKEVISTSDLAEEACRVEIDILKHPIGKQDQYAAAYGGINWMEIDKNGHVAITPLSVCFGKIKKIENDLIIFFTNIKREGEQILDSQNKKTNSNHQPTMEYLHKIKEIGVLSKKALERGDMGEYGKLMDEHWQTKRKLSGKISNSEIDKWYQIALENGALGGKLMGAGGGGFMMFCCPGDENKVRLREAMSKEGLRELDYRFDFEGTKILANI